MALPTVRDQFLRDLDQRQLAAADLVRGLLRFARGVCGKDLLRFAGCMDGNSSAS